MSYDRINESAIAKRERHDFREKPLYRQPIVNDTVLEDVDETYMTEDFTVEDGY